MIFRLGYVAMTMNLQDASPSGTVTASNLEKLQGEEARFYRLRKIARKNLENTLRILRYNQAYHFQVYRLTSKLIPLATYPGLEGWDYTGEFAEEFRTIGDFILENGFRISAHPDHFTLINSISEKVLRDAVRDLDYHVKVYEAMGLQDYKYKLVLHVGGLYKNKEASVTHFKENFLQLPDRIRKRLILENDDKSYTAKDVLGICQEVGMPMVLDVHHHMCANGGEHLEDLLPDIFHTWDKEAFPPKVHFSSPKSGKDFRSHADYIDQEDFFRFLGSAAKAGRDFDVMLEAKAKDSALLKLSQDLEGFPGVRKINEAAFEIMQ